MKISKLSEPLINAGSIISGSKRTMTTITLTHHLVIMLVGGIALLTLTSCATRTVYVPHGQPVKLAEDVKAKVWVNANGEKVKTEMTIPEGWYCLPKD
jgi:hypothetical protein